jgi:hypothetical protein
MKSKGVSKMTAISFNAIIEGNTIRIPLQYAKQINSKVKVVLLPQSTEIVNKSGSIPFYGFDTTDYKFDREEANER